MLFFSKLLIKADQPYHNVTGVSDFPPIVQQVELIKSYFKKDSLKTVGILYNPGEATPHAITKAFCKELAKRNIKCVFATVTKTTDIPSAMQTLIGKEVQTVYVGNDNTVVSGMDAAIKVATQYEIPIFCSDPESVDRGCVATISPDQYEMGKQTGDMVNKILQGQSIESIQPAFAKKLIHKTNHNMIKKLGLHHHPVGGSKK